MRKGSYGEMRIKVRGIPPPYPQDATVLGCSRFCTPRRRGERPDGQRHTSRQASLEQLATMQTTTSSSSEILRLHGNPPCGSVTLAPTRFGRQRQHTLAASATKLPGKTCAPVYAKRI